MPSDKSKIVEIVAKPKDGNGPLLVHFQNGDLKTSENLDASFFMGCDVRNKKRKLSFLATDKFVYCGAINEGFPTDLVDTFIAIRNKTTNKVRLIQVDEVSMKNTLYDDLGAENPAATEEGVVNRNVLYKTFGGRKSSRYAERLDRMKVNVDVIKNQIDQAIENFDEKDEADTSKEKAMDNLDMIRPTFDAAATKREEIYTLTDIIPGPLLNRLEPEVDVILTTKVEKVPFSSEFIANGIRELQKLEDNEDTRTKVKMYLYMDALINLVKSKEKDMSKMILSKITEKIETDVRFRFSHPESARMLKTVQARHKAICYFITLAILTRPNFEIDIGELGTALSIAKTSIIKFGRAVNCKPKAKTDILTLCLPSKVTLGKLFTAKKRF